MLQQMANMGPAYQDPLGRCEVDFSKLLPGDKSVSHFYDYHPYSVMMVE